MYLDGTGINKTVGLPYASSFTCIYRYKDTLWLVENNREIVEFTSQLNNLVKKIFILICPLLISFTASKQRSNMTVISTQVYNRI